MSVHAVRRSPDSHSVFHVEPIANDDGPKPGYFACIDGTPIFRCDTYAEAARAKRFLELVPALAVDI